MQLDERALLVKLSITAWSARKTDDEVSREVTENKHAREGAGKFRKQLIGKEALAKINKLASAARTSHYAMTMPWNDDGARIITTEGYQAYTKTMRQYRMDIEQAVSEFITEYNGHVKQAQQDLGKLFKKDDYPSVDEIKGKFSFDFEPAPIPMAHDFRAKVSDADVKTITKDIERRLQERINTAMKDVWERIAKVTKHMSEKLDEYVPNNSMKGAEGVFRDSLVENIRELVKILPSLNLSNDPKLDAVYKDMVDSLCQYDAAELRTDERARRKTSRKAKAIYDKVSKYLA